MVSAILPRLVADCSLGKLVVYLRLAGIDTLFDPGVPDAKHLFWLSQGERTILTRCRRVKQALGSKPVIYINHNQPMTQVREVITALNLDRGDLKPLTRCSRCNQLLQSASKLEISGHVPEHVWQTHKTFKKCLLCERIYWSGSHAERWLTNLDRWFEDKN